MTVKQRNKLLAEMTDEVGQLVLRNNYAQNTALANALAQSQHCSTPSSASCAAWCRDGPPGPGAGVPAHRPPDPRAARTTGTGPDPARSSAVLLAYTKITVADELISHRAAGRPVPAAAAARLLPDARCASGSPSRSTATRCAARSSRRCWSTTRSTRGGSTLPAPAARGDRRLAGGDRAGADRGPRDLRPRRGVGRGRGARQHGRGRRPDPDPAALAPARRARHPLAAQQPAAAAAARRDRSSSSASGVEQVWARAAEAAAGRGPGVVPDDPRRADRRRRPGRAGRAGGRVLLRLPGAGHRGGRRPYGQGPAGRRRGVLRPRRPAAASPSSWTASSSCRARDRWQSMARASIREDLYAAHAALTSDVLAVGQRHARRPSSASRRGRRRTRRSWAGRAPPWRRSRARRRSTWRTCRWRCGRCGRCCGRTPEPVARRRRGGDDGAVPSRTARGALVRRAGVGTSGGTATSWASWASPRSR